MIYIGIDPGKSGALAQIDKKGNTGIVTWDERSYIETLGAEWLKNNCIVCLEHVGPMPKQGVTSTFNFGMNFGYIKGLLEAFGIPYELVRPQKWKKEFSITGDKNSSIEVCRRLFPGVPLKRTPKCRTDDNNIAEALLMAEYARRRL